MGNKMMLSVEQRALLDRIYNLKSEDSNFIFEINKRIEQNKTDYTVLFEEAKDLEVQKKTITNKRSELDTQYTKILEDLKGIKRNSYGTLLDEANEEFDPEEMLERIKEKIPKRIENIDTQINEFQTTISANKKKITENEIEAKEWENKLSDAIQTQERLVKLIDESLHGNGSITRDSVQELLLSLGFVEDETIELGKMILFPQGTLTVYDEEHKSKKKTGKSIEEVFKTAQEASKVEKEVVEIKEEITADKPVLANEELIKKNIEYLKSLGIKKEVIKGNEQVLTDIEFQDKVKFYLDLGKSKEDLELCFEILLAYSLSDLKDLKKICTDHKVKMEIIPLKLLKSGLGEFFDNIALLPKYNIKIDETEMARAINALFIDNKTFKSNLEILDKYKLKIAKKDGGNVLNVLALESDKLIKGLDAIIEAGALKLLQTKPEVLTDDLVKIANRIIYCKANELPIENESGEFYDFIFSDDEFNKIFEGIDLGNINVVLGKDDHFKAVYNTVKSTELLDVISQINLNDYYLKNPLNVDDVINDFKNLEITKEGIKVLEKEISIERLKRNVAYLLSNGVKRDHKELEIVAILYNSIYDEITMNKIADRIEYKRD